MLKYADNSIVSNPGSEIHIIYSPVVTENGNFELVESGKENIHDYIQSQASNTDMSYIISRMAVGDMSVLVDGATYGDFTSVPDSLAGVLQLQIDSNNLFNKLPLEVREKFDYDPNKFFAQSGSNEWLEKLSPVLSDDVRKLMQVKTENIEKGDKTEE